MTRNCHLIVQQTLPTDGVALWLLGASSVIGVDYNNIAKPKEVARAVKAADARVIESQLRQLHLDADWSGRLNSVMQWAQARSDGFPPGYTYIAPADVIASPSLIPHFDVLVSTSVLEHIRPSLMVSLLDAFASRANENAAQYHRVDLRDHRDFESNPYGFHDPSAQFDPEADADTRGNGMTLQDWEALVASHPRWRLRVDGYEPGRAHLVPPTAPLNGRQIADSLLLRSVTA